MRKIKFSCTSKVFGKNVRGYRDKIGITQVALAEKSGLTQSSITNVEIAKSESVNATTIFAIADGLGVTVLDLALEDNSEHDAILVVDEFLESQWAKSLNIKEQEIKWLKSLPLYVFSDPIPLPQHMMEIVLWKRRKDTEAQKDAPRALLHTKEKEKERAKAMLEPFKKSKASAYMEPSAEEYSWLESLINSGTIDDLDDEGIADIIKWRRSVKSRKNKKPLKK